MIKLTRLNNHMVAINPDHIAWADSNPDTTLCLAGGDKILVRESLDELIALVLDYRRSIRAAELPGRPEDSVSELAAIPFPRPSQVPSRRSSFPRGER
ncbi:MAG: flagellar FlbD family protein [Polyangiaceae bacterium]